MEKKTASKAQWVLLIAIIVGAIYACTGDRRASRPRTANLPDSTSQREAPSRPAGPAITHEQSERLAMLINLNGELCGRVVRVTRIDDRTSEIECARYRDGSGRATYLLDWPTGRVK